MGLHFFGVSIVNADPRGDVQVVAPLVVIINTYDLKRDKGGKGHTMVHSGTGSGFFWDNLGHIVTNEHVSNLQVWCMIGPACWCKPIYLIN